jgi:hypothetical protein
MFYIQWHHLAKKDLSNKVYVVVVVIIIIIIIMGLITLITKQVLHNLGKTCAICTSQVHELFITIPRNVILVVFTIILSW